MSFAAPAHYGRMASKDELSPQGRPEFSLSPAQWDELRVLLERRAVTRATLAKALRMHVERVT
jgi:hypothetical protein